MNKKYVILSALLLIITQNNFAMFAKTKEWLSKQNWYKPTTRQWSTQAQSPALTKPIDFTTKAQDMKSKYDDSFFGALSSTIKRLIMPKQYSLTSKQNITYDTSTQTRLRELDNLKQNPTDTSWSAWFGLGQNKQAISRGAEQTKERLVTSIKQAGSNSPLIQKRLVELSAYEQPALTELEDIKIMSDPNEGAKGQIVVRMPDPRYIAGEQAIVKDAENARKRLITDAQILDQSPVLLNEAVTLNKKWLETKKLYNAAVLTNNEKAQSTLEQRLSDIDARRELLLKHAPLQIKK